MITKTQALWESRFHANRERRTDGTCYVWRRTGQTQTWKTRPNDFSVPVKYGLKSYGKITHLNAEGFHAESECPHGNKW